MSLFVVNKKKKKKQVQFENSNTNLVWEICNASAICKQYMKQKAQVTEDKYDTIINL